MTIAGSSGRIDADRARVLASHGALAMSLRWFGGSGQQPGPWHVPIEIFMAALDRLAPESDRLAIMGTSFGAEAALLTACHYSGVDAAIGFAPSSVVCGSFVQDEHGGVSQRSHWTFDGNEVPFVPLTEGWVPRQDPPAFKDWYQTSMPAAPDRVHAATIPVERIPEVLLVAGGDDQVWPSSSFATAITARRFAHGMATTVVADADAGHRTTLPGEMPPLGGLAMARGGTPEGDNKLGAAAWPHLVSALGLHDHRH